MNADFLDRDPAHGERSALFQNQGYLVVAGLIEQALAHFLWSYVHTKFASRLLQLGDDQVASAPRDYGDPAFDGLLEYLRPRVEKCTGLALHPTYSYFRLYKSGDVLPRHRDRPACEISVSLNVGQLPADQPWPLSVEAHDSVYQARLSPGDALVYRGVDHVHWRDAYAGNRLVQVFLHYVDRNGPHGKLRFDGRPSLMRPRLQGESQETH